jgi:hypothetical protein
MPRYVLCRVASSPFGPLRLGRDGWPSTLGAVIASSTSKSCSLSVKAPHVKRGRGFASPRTDQLPGGPRSHLWSNRRLGSGGGRFGSYTPNRTPSLISVLGPRPLFSARRLHDGRWGVPARVSSDAAARSFRAARSRGRYPPSRQQEHSGSRPLPLLVLASWLSGLWVCTNLLYRAALASERLAQSLLS